jgi:predicted dehydrogenase
MPKRVRAFCAFGKYHRIEVEDDVTAFVEYENGASGVFIASTGETSGTNRLEIIGDQGKAVIEDDSKLSVWHLQVPEQINHEASGGFSQPQSCKSEIPVSSQKTNHAGITTNWVEAILKGSPQLAPGIDGIQALELSNAMYLSTWTDNWVKLPVNEELFFNQLQARIKKGESSSRVLG